MQLASAVGRLGTESAFEVLARAKALELPGARSSISASASPTSPPRRTSSRRRPRRCATAITATRRPTASCRCARRWRPTSTGASSVTVSPDNILIVPGGKVTMFFAMLMFGEPGGEIIYPDPGFPIYASAINFTGAKAVPLPLLEKNGFAFTAEDVLGRITPRTRLIILNSPANPTGGVTPKAEADKLAEGLKQHPDVAVMSDEIYGQMLYDGREHVTMLRLRASARPPDPARRLEQDLRDDRLAAGLRRLAGLAHRGRHAPGHQLPFLRQRRGAVRRHRRAHRPAGRGRADDGRLRRAPPLRGQGAERAARRLLHRARRRLLRLPQHHRRRA